MARTCNVGGVDRGLRVALGAFLVALAVSAFRRGRRLRGVVLGVAGLALLGSAATGYCRLNEALGVDTTGGDADVDADDEAVDLDVAESEA